MNYAELVQEVYSLTNRPDQVALTASAIKSATLKAHKSDFFSRDLYETGIDFVNDDYIQSLDLISLVPNFRAMKYLRKYDEASATAGAFIQLLKVEDTIDEYGADRTDIAYVAGRTLEIKSSTVLDKCLFACYVNPIVTEAGFSSWIADLSPYAIVYDAARVIFKTIGYDEEAATYRELVAEQYQLLKMEAITDIGH